ncbi:MAG: NUDIX hydrolase [Elusimicrobia bacterium]|nr:NUDIX hydrolase [Elusimicrobiota bacterium]
MPPVGSAGRRSPGEEYSAGGVVTRDGKVLLVKVENLKGERLWTFPKGHLDPGETPKGAALREVHEETGFECDVIGPLTLVRYMFMREGRLVRKRVRWYWMRPLRRSGSPDAVEVLDVRWCAPAEAAGLLKYPGDKRLLTLIEAKLMNVSEKEDAG